MTDTQRLYLDDDTLYLKVFDPDTGCWCDGISLGHVEHAADRCHERGLGHEWAELRAAWDDAGSVEDDHAEWDRTYRMQHLGEFA